MYIEEIIIVTVVWLFQLHILWQYTIAGLDRWTGPVDWNGGLVEIVYYVTNNYNAVGVD